MFSLMDLFHYIMLGIYDSGFGDELCKGHIQVMKELVHRDKNRPSVVMWSIGNEPKSLEGPATNYFKYAKLPFSQKSHSPLKKFRFYLTIL